MAAATSSKYQRMAHQSNRAKRVAYVSGSVIIVIGRIGSKHQRMTISGAPAWWHRDIQWRMARGGKHHQRQWRGVTAKPQRREKRRNQCIKATSRRQHRGGGWRHKHKRGVAHHQRASARWRVGRKSISNNIMSRSVWRRQRAKARSA